MIHASHKIHEKKITLYFVKKNVVKSEKHHSSRRNDRSAERTDVQIIGARSENKKKSKGKPAKNVSAIQNAVFRPFKAYGTEAAVVVVVVVVAVIRSISINGLNKWRTFAIIAVPHGLIVLCHCNGGVVVRHVDIKTMTVRFL